MVESKPRYSKLTVTKRSLQQDAENAMGSDPIRAIIELVTNADDAYEAVQNAGKGTKGKIRIEVDRRRGGSPTTLRVLDRARGMTHLEMEERLGKLGGRTSGFESGAQLRGLFGRGAKDIAHFGPVRWESKRKSEHTSFEILEASDDIRIIQLPKAEYRDSGTTVTLEIQPRFRIPQEANLMERLKRHYALRPILEDRRGREVTLNGTKVVYEPPRGKLLHDRQRLPVNGYVGHECVLTLYESGDFLEDNQPWEFWRHSLLIRSGRAAYEVFQGGKFGRGAYSQYLGKLFGTVDVPGLNTLIREYDDYLDHAQKPPDSNPIRLVRRDRYGLVNRNDHPYVDALYETIEAALLPHLQRLRDEAERGTSVRLSDNQRRRFDRVSKVLSNYLEDVEPGGSGGAGRLPEVGLQVIPSLRVVAPGERGQVSVRYRPSDLLDDPPAAELWIEDEEGEHEPVRIPMTPRADGAYFTYTYRSPGRQEGAVTILRVGIDGIIREGLIEWRDRPDPDPVESMRFDSASYTVRDGAQRTARLLAPWDSVVDGTIIPRVEIHGDPGLQLVGQALLFVFDYDESLRAGVCPITVRGSGVGARARIVATASGEAAEAEVRVTTGTATGIRPDIGEFGVPQRAWLEGTTLKVNALDPSVKAYLGPKKDGWPGMETPHFNAMLAEILASTVVRHKLQQKHYEPYDVSRLFREYSDEIGKLLPRVHAALVPASDRRAVEPWR